MAREGSMEPASELTDQVSNSTKSNLSAEKLVVTPETTEEMTAPRSGGSLGRVGVREEAMHLSDCRPHPKTGLLDEPKMDTHWAATRFLLLIQ